jgi:hypothetical protein
MQDGGEPNNALHRRTQRTLDYLGLTPAGAWRALGCIAVGLAGSLLFVWLHMPLPWFLGSLAACIIASASGLPIDRPKFLSIPMRAVLGIAIGSAFTPALFAQIGPMTLSLLLLVPFMLAIMVGGMWFFEHYAGCDRPTAFFCAVPGGLTDMVSMAADAGANARTVTLIQATRIVLLVFLIPVWLQLVSGHKVAGLAPQGVWMSQFLLVDAVVLIAMGWIGWKLAKRVGLAGAPLIGPMLLSGLLHAVGWTTAKVPVEVLIAAQVAVGAMLGAQFRGLTMHEFRSTMTWGIAFSVVLVAASAAIATIISRLTGFDSTTVLLAYAPGGQSELNLLAYLLGLDAAFTALHHLVRLAIVIFGAQIVFATHKDWRKKDEDGGF